MSLKDHIRRVEGHIKTVFSRMINYNIKVSRYGVIYDHLLGLLIYNPVNMVNMVNMGKQG